MSQISIESTEKKVLEFLKVCPRTPTQIGIFLKLSREHVTRAILKPMLESEKISKVEGSHLYQVKGFSLERKNIDRILAQDSKFDDCQTIKNWRAGNTRKNRESIISQFKFICTGNSKYTSNSFKINPDSWIHPQDTENIIAEVRANLKTDLLPHGFRDLIRAFLIYGLKYQLLEAESLRLGIPLPKDKPVNARLNCSTERYDKILDSLESSERLFCIFGFSFGTFCRPSSRYIVKCSDLFFFDRKTDFIQFKDGTIETDPKKISQLRDNYQVETKIQRAVDLEMLENKTGVTYPKNLFDERVVKKLEIYTKKRISAGMVYLFWNNNDTSFTFENYDGIVRRQLQKDGKDLSKIFLKVGFAKGDFGKYDRANYAVRHFGVQWWLQATNYDYGTIAEMGWEDIETLRSWYGKMTPEHRMKTLSGVFYN